MRKKVIFVVCLLVMAFSQFPSTAEAAKLNETAKRAAEQKKANQAAEQKKVAQQAASRPKAAVKKIVKKAAQSSPR